MRKPAFTDSEHYTQIRHNCCFYDRERHLSYICLSPYLSSLLVSCFGNLSASIWHHQVHWPGGCLPCWQQSSTHGAPNSAGANGMVADSVNLERQSFTSWGLCYFGWPCGGQQLWCCTPTFDGAKFWKTWHVSTFKRKGKPRRPKWRWWVSNIFNGSLVSEKTHSLKVLEIDINRPRFGQSQFASIFSQVCHASWCLSNPPADNNYFFRMVFEIGRRPLYFASKPL